MKMVLAAKFAKAGRELRAALSYDLSAKHQTPIKVIFSNKIKCFAHILVFRRIRVNYLDI